MRKLSGKARHGQAGTKIYKTWGNIKSRCNNPNATKYYIYGGKGIKICEEWIKFENFYEWSLKNGYKEGLTIDRINGNGNYEPSNCRWVTYKVQSNNTTQNHLLTFNGETLNISQWAEKLKVNSKMLGERIRRGWSVERALTTPKIFNVSKDNNTGRFLSGTKTISN